MRPAFLLALLLAGCASTPPTPPLSANEASCARQADNDPVVKDLLLKAAGSAGFARNNEDRIKAAQQDATVACLRARGIVRGGGVERQRPL